MAEVFTLTEIESSSWLKFYASRWGVLTLSYWGQAYIHNWKKAFGKGLTKVILVSRKGIATSFFETKDYEAYGKHLASQAEANDRYVLEFCATLKRKVDEMNSLIESLQARPTVGQPEFFAFMDVFAWYGPWHSGIKILTDHLSPALLAQYKEDVTSARLYSEHTLVKTEGFLERFARDQSTAMNLPPELVLCLLKEELETYFFSGVLPLRDVLQARFDESVLLFKPERYEIRTGGEVAKVEHAIYKLKEGGVTKGTPAFHGKATGVVRIIHNPSQVAVFNQGDVLVTGMTRPDFVPLLKKAGAVVTDGGGILCHAAIVAREFGIPTVIGTHNATKAFQDGDVVEVDADNGTVKIKRA